MLAREPRRPWMCSSRQVAAEPVQRGDRAGYHCRAAAGQRRDRCAHAQAHGRLGNRRQDHPWVGGGHAPRCDCLCRVNACGPFRGEAAERSTDQGLCLFHLPTQLSLQAVVTQAALTSLAAGHDSDPLHGQTDHVVTGLLLLFVSLIGRVPAETYKAQGKARGKDSEARTGVAAL
jgi:hypothetical protein